MMKLQQNTKRIFSAALIFWMSGVIVLFCCGNMPTVKAASEEIESCPLAKKGHCAKTSEENTDYSFNQESNAFDCCAFPARIFDKVRKIEKSPESAMVVEAVEVSTLRFYLTAKTYQTPQFYQSFVRNRGSTYLQNRVFRI
jgi:hypothetical protein